MNWYLGVLPKYAVFSGRAGRQEYWMFTLFNVLVSIILIAIDAAVKNPALGSLYSLAVLVPSLAVSVRRLHDTGRSGWWILISLVPIVGWIVLLVFMTQDSELGDNQYGPNLTLATV